MRFGLVFCVSSFCVFSDLFFELGVFWVDVPFFCLEVLVILFKSCFGLDCSQYFL